jgi:UDP-N-acetylglucosamine 4,6-dehydratase
VNILIVGGTGTLGNELTRQLSSNHRVSIFSRDELKQQEMRRRFPDCRFILGDIRDRLSIRHALNISEPEAVYHVAALKQVDTCEANPGQCIETNVNGTVTLADECIARKVPFLAFSSSDKACLPINIYGQCKAVSERFLLGSNLMQNRTRFSVFRWGNVVGSRGSAIPFFIKCLKDGRSVPITDLNMTRFWVSIEEAAMFFSSNIKTAPLDMPIFPDMKACTVIRVVESLGRLLQVGKCQFHEVGIRAGEKIHETIHTSHEGCVRSDTAPQFSDGELDNLLEPVVWRHA